MIEKSQMRRMEDIDKISSPDVPSFAREMKPNRVRDLDDANKRLEISPIRQNYERGKAREELVASELEKQYPEGDGYKVLREVPLRDAEGNIVRDPVTGEGRRLDFAVVRDGRVDRTIEVTSMTAEKEAQSAKEERIRNQGGNYVQDPETGELYEIREDVTTDVERRP